MPDSRSILYSAGRNDECYTPSYVVEAIEPYLPKGKVIWCPFDLEDSAFVRVLRGAGHEVVHSHRDTGQDYFLYEPTRWDLMLSNPPFTGKREVFARALSFGKPFGLLMTLTWLNDSAPKDLFAGRDLQLFLFRDRIRFLDRDGTPLSDRITFASAFYCCDLLPRQIIIHNAHQR